MKFEKRDAKLAKRKAAKEKRIAETKMYIETDTWTEFELKMSAKGLFPRHRFLSRHWWDYIFSNNGWDVDRLTYAFPLFSLAGLLCIAITHSALYVSYFISFLVGFAIAAVGAFLSFKFRPWVESVSKETVRLTSLD